MANVEPTSPIQQLQARIQQSSAQLSWNPAIFSSVLAYLRTISDPTQQKQIVDQLIQAIDSGPNSDLIGDNAKPETWLAKAKSLASTATPSPAQAAAQKQSSAQTQANQAPITAATAVGAQLSETAPFPGGEVPVMGTGATDPRTGQPLTQPGNARGGTTPSTERPGAAGFNEQLQAYYDQEFATAGTDVNQLAQLAGTDPDMLQRQYQQYQQGITAARAQWTGHGALPDTQPPAMLSLPQFAQSKAQSMVGPWASVMEAIGLVWQSQTESTLPAGLAQQIITALNGMPSDQKQNVLYMAMQYMANAASAAGNKSVRDQTGSLTASMLAALPSTILGFSGGSGGVGSGSFTSAGIIGTALNSAPFLVGQQTTAAIQNAFESALHRAPSAADMAALGSNPSDLQIQQYIANQPVPGTAMTYGVYSEVTKSLNPMWEQYFGRVPTAAELTWAVGKSPADLQSFVDNSPSSIPGVTIGRKTDYENFISGLGTSGATTHAFSGAVDDSVISELHQQVTGASTGKAHPGAL